MPVEQLTSQPSIRPAPRRAVQQRPVTVWRTCAWMVTGALTIGASMVACGGGTSSTTVPATAATPDGGTAATETPTGTTPVTPTATTPATTTSPGTTPSVSLAAPKATVLTTALSKPWSLAILPDGRFLITQKDGTMVLVSADGKTVSGSLGGLPAVVTSESQGGLLDVALDPDFSLASNPWIYWAYSEPTAGNTSNVAVARGRLTLGAAALANNASPGSLQSVQVIYRQVPRVDVGAGQHGARLVFRADKTLFVTLGDRQRDQPNQPTTEYAQSLATTLGKVVRINRDGGVPADNPFASTSGALREIWSLGHRNPQGAAINPANGDLWLTEHGPQGGDELNHVNAGANYGWPLRSYGCPYGTTVGDACRVGGGTHAPAFTEPVSFWTPLSMAPSGMTFYTGSKFPEWQNNVLMGALQTKPGYSIERGLWRVALSGDTVTARERLTLVDERVRDVRQGADGWVYLLTDSGQLIRIER